MTRLGGFMRIERRLVTICLSISAVSLALFFSGCAPSPPPGSVSAAEAKQVALGQIAQGDAWAGWQQALTDPNTKIAVTYEQTGPTGVDVVRTPADVVGSPVWKVVVTAASNPATDPAAPWPSMSFYVSMKGEPVAFQGTADPNSP